MFYSNRQVFQLFPGKSIRRSFRRRGSWVLLLRRILTRQKAQELRYSEFPAVQYHLANSGYSFAQ